MRAIPLLFIILAVTSSCGGVRSTNLSDSKSDPAMQNQWFISKIGADKLWDEEIRIPKSVVAVIDTGIQLDHDYLVNRLWVNPGESGWGVEGSELATNGIDDDQNGYIDDSIGWNFADGNNDASDVLSHGTKVAGLIGAVNPWAQIMPLKVFADKQYLDAEATSKIWAEAIVYAVDNGASVISVSLGVGHLRPDLANAIKYAENKAVMIVASAGNHGRDNDITPRYPGSFQQTNIIAVAASTQSDELWAHSNFGIRNVDLAAPGHEIWVTDIENSYTLSSGTSEATPIVAGSVSLLMSIFPELHFDDIKRAIMDSCQRLDGFKEKVRCEGRLDLYAAYRLLKMMVE